MKQLKEVNSDSEARAKGFPKGGSFKVLEQDIILATVKESEEARAQVVKSAVNSN